jgi:hypothetical protein
MYLNVAPQDSECEFDSNFEPLHVQIPDLVGHCTSPTIFEASSGDVVQTTSHGLLVWRKFDSHPVFTDGSTTWIDGPHGLEQRPNQARLTWEDNPDRLPIVPRPRPGDRCHTAGVHWREPSKATPP